MHLFCRKSRLLSLRVAILLSLAGPARAAVINARSASQSDVGAAISSAKDGDTVIVPEGTVSWTDTVTVNKAITLQGAGIGKTLICDDLSINGSNLVINTTLGKFYRLTGFEFRRGERTRPLNKGCVLVNGTTKTFRIDHCKYHHLLNRPIFVRGAACGVIDHCEFFGVGAIAIFHDKWDGKMWGDGSWALPADWGGTNAVYVEDNNFSDDNTTPGKAVIDEYAGARWVFRYNKVHNRHIDSHGTGSTSRFRSTRHWEIYNNTLTANPPEPEAIHMRGGTGVIFDNTTTGFLKFTTLHTYRFKAGFRDWPGSDGTSGWDLNDPKVYASGTAGAGSGIGPNGDGGKLVVPGAGWATNQWIGYVIRDLDGLSNTQPPNRRGRGVPPGPFFGTIFSNTSDTILVKGGSQQTNKIFAAGDRFEIRKVLQSLDMIGASTGELLSGRASSPKWPKQEIEPVYVWNNTKDGEPNNGVAIAPDSPIREGVHFFNNKAKPNYKPLVHPHPLVTGDATKSSQHQLSGQ
jgi:hypothetical protein